MIKAVLFDFDGTLGNSYVVTVAALQKTLKKFNLSIPNRSIIGHHFGLPRRKFLEAFLPEDNKANLDEMEEYFHQLSVQMIAKVTLMPGAKALLNKLEGKYELAMISSRGGDTLIAILNHHNIQEHFRVVIHRESVKEHKPHPEGILQVLNKLQLEKTEVVFVGDAKEDVGAAKNAGVTSVLLGKENTHNADYHITSLKDLPTILEQL